MKDSISKKLFIGFSLIIVLLAILIIYEQAKNKKDNLFQNEPIKEELVKEMKLGIVQMDVFNPLFSTNKYVHQISRLMYESLVDISKDYKVEPMLAKEWGKISENTYVVKLNEGIKFSSGKELVASDVINTVNTIKTAEISVYKDNVSNISNITQIDDYTLKIELADGNELFFVYNLIFPIVEAETYLGTGMFKIAEMLENKIILERNANYAKSESQKINIITINLYNSVGEMYNAFKFKGLDFLTTTRLDYMDYIGTLGYGYKQIKSRDFTYIAINTNKNMLKDTELRRAIKHAINKEEIVSKLFSNKYFASDFPLEYGSYLYDTEDKKSEYNTEKAKEILLKNGWEYKNSGWQKKVGNNVEHINFSLAVEAGNDENILVAELIKEQLELIRNKSEYSKSK
ncbi:MAG: ABC transporter substrate-binding protein [Lachnospiraceae bacterium]|jgi:ABC-type transport system substrate-binding protein|nr:ABC transporter substrate-binding protein [Lachnospiraceae bacterium]